MPINPGVFIVCGLAFGDEGKGTITDFLVRQKKAPLVVRFNGGSQAAHHVVLPDGRWFCFSQFGSGTFIPGVKTFLSRFMLVDPLNLQREEKALRAVHVEDAYSRLFIDRQCLVITPFHKIINQMREIARGEKAFGSCGKGTGEAMADEQTLGPQTLRIGDLENRTNLRRKIDFIWRIRCDIAEQLLEEHRDNAQLNEYYDKITASDYPDWTTEALLKFYHSTGVNFVSSDWLRKYMKKKPDTSVVFEGAQGVLLDRDCGFWPHVTATRTTFDNALELLDDADYAGRLIKIGVLRTYMTRHGVGPFVTEDQSLDKLLPEKHNGTNPWQKQMRFGWLDAVAIHYAIRIAQPDMIALTHSDVLEKIPEFQICQAYSYTSTGERSSINALSPIGPTDFDGRTEMTQILLKCRPHYSVYNLRRTMVNATSHTQQAFPLKKELEEILTVPISILSFGPTADEKETML